MAQLKFETALKRLEKTVQSLERGDLPLEEALKVFEEGVRLSKSCMKTLSEAEKKVEILIEGKKGARKSQAFSGKKLKKETEDALSG